MSNIFFTSDLHFFHENVIQFCARPYSCAEHMNECLIDNWNKVVNDGDVVWVLGDVSFGKIEATEEILYRLKGRKRLIIGNHDRKGRCEKLDWAAHFDEMYDYKRIHAGGHKFVLCHFPFYSWERGYINLHGHTHGTYQSRLMQHDVGVDVNNYTPLSLEDAVSRAIANGKPERTY